MSERTLQDACRRLLVYLQNRGAVLEFYHTWDSRRSRPGFPDFAIVMNREESVTWMHFGGARTVAMNETLYVELKSAVGKLTPDQERWRAGLGPRHHVCRDIDEFIDALGVRELVYDAPAPIKNRSGKSPKILRVPPP